MSVIEGASVSVKTMSDGTLRLSIDIEPRNAQAAFMLFGAPGRAVALAALKDGSAAVKETVKNIPEIIPGKPKGGEWAKLAGMWSNDRDFWLFIEHLYREKITDASRAAEYLRAMCKIESRADLDNDPEALKRFNERLRHPFMKWMEVQGIRK